MSTVIVLKANDTLILATDSRFMRHDYTEIASDDTRKIWEIGPETFIATSGRKWACDFQTERARELANEMLGGPIDIQALGETLKAESLPILMTLVERLRLEPDETTKQQVSGESLLHGCVLAGRTASGQLGYVFHSYRVQAGKIECEVESYFEDRRRIKCSTGVPLHLLAGALGFMQDPTIWTDPPVSVVQKILTEMKRSTPMIGGPNQIVCLDRGGAHWIARPPRPAIPLIEDLATATITATVTMTSPVIVITSGPVTINLDATNYFKLVDTGTNRIVQADNTGVKAGSTAVPAQYAKLDANGALVASNSSRLLSIGAGYSATASAGSGALPAAPAGFMEWIFGGATVHIPYYN